MDRNQLRRLIRDLDQVYTAPVVFHPGGWGQTAPEDLLRRVGRERLALAVAGQWDRATESETLGYLYSLSLTQPMGQDWTDIYLYLAARWRPEARQVVAAPTALTQHQEDLLADLQRRIRSSQKRTKKESNMTSPVIKIIVNLEEGKEEAHVAFGRDDCDPIIMPPVALGEDRLPDLLAQVPGMLAQAREQWAQSPRYPQSAQAARSQRGRRQAPQEAASGQSEPEPGPDPGPQPEPELPLLAGAESQPESIQEAQDVFGGLEEGPAAAAAPASQPDVPDVPGYLPDSGEGAGISMPDNDRPPAEEAPEGEERPSPLLTPAEPGLALGVAGAQPPEEEPQGSMDLFSGLDEPPARAQPAPATARAATGNIYYLSDGRGPFNTTHEALDALGVPQEGRGKYWDRHDRLPKKYQDQVDKRARA